MGFITKLDYSNNRQIKQYAETITVLSGGTRFGLPFSALTSGPDLSTSGISQTYTSLASTFSGNTGTTNYTWYDSRMSLGQSALSALTPSNSAMTQHTGNIYTPSSITSIDGNIVNLAYTGVSFDISNIAMVDLGGGNYSGTVATFELNILSAHTLDFTGRTIWVDVSGITRTEDLIITNNPTIGYIFTCIDSEGKGQWQPSSGGTSGGTSYWSASTGTNAIVIINSNSLASGLNSSAEGFNTTASGDYSHAQGNATIASGTYSYAEGNQTKASGIQSHAEGFQTTASSYTTHVEGVGTLANGLVAHAEGQFTKASGETAHAEGYQTTAGGFQCHAEGYITTAVGQTTHAEGGLTLATGDYSHAEGNSTTALGVRSHAGGYSSIASGNTSFVHGQFSFAGGNGAIVLGDNITGLTNNYTYVESLNIKTVGSAGFVNDIRIDGNGNLTTNTSDFRLKENINTLTNALDKIKKLRGVTYQWKDKSAGGDALRIGFIAQEVEQVDPLLVFTNKNDGYMGLHIDSVIPLLVEAVKELSSGNTTYGNVYLETQTIFAEDNNIELNYSGNTQTAIGGGVKVLHAIGLNKSSELITDEKGNWVTNTDFNPKGLSIPTYTPSSSNDENGNEGNITRDDNYLYVKTINGWKRSNLESF